jgi:hypothetical protein
MEIREIRIADQGAWNISLKELIRFSKAMAPCFTNSFILERIGVIGERERQITRHAHKTVIEASQFGKLFLFCMRNYRPVNNHPTRFLLAGIDDPKEWLFQIFHDTGILALQTLK